MELLKLDIQMFADGTIVISTELDTRNFENGLNAMQNKAKSGGASIKNIVAGLGITKLISSAFNTISNSMDDAIKRVDTLNNFPRVMSNLGISAEDAQKSIDKMGKKLLGLPTTLDQGALAVQRFTSKNGDVAKSTDLFLALNNAILAGGAPTEMQATALEQLAQAYAKGKPDMMEWRSAMSAMPAQLKQVAEAMGYVDADALGEALRSGKVSMDDFMDTITKLNKKGIDGFQSFEKQARNSTGGIANSITVAKTQVVKGLADMITAVNRGLQEANLPSIGEIIATIGKKAKEVLDVVANNLPQAIQLFKDLIPYLTAIGTAILAWKVGTTIQSMVTGFQEAKLALQLFTMQTEATTIAQGLMNGTLSIAEGLVALLTGKMTLAELAQAGMAKAQALLNAVMSANPIGLVALAVAGLVTAFVLLWKKSEAFRNFWIGLWEDIKKAFEPVINSLVEMFKSAWDLIKVVWDKVQPYFQLIFNNIKIFVDVLKNNLATSFQTAWKLIKIVWDTVAVYFKTVFDTITGIFKAVKSVLSGDFKGAWEAIKSVFAGWGNYFRSLFNSLVNVFATIGSHFLSIGKNIVTGIWNGISGSLSWIKSKISGWVGNVTSFIKKLFGIHSPSTVFRDEVGKMLARGIGVGFEEGIDDVYKDMQDAIDFETSKMSANVQSSGTYQMAMANTPTFNLVDNATNKTQLTVDGKVLAEVVNTENRNREVAKA